MFLVLDVGNTNTVIGLHREVGSPRSPHAPKFEKLWRVSTHPIGTADEFRLKLSLLLAEVKVKLTDVKAVVVSSVVPGFTEMLRFVFVSGPVSGLVSGGPQFLLVDSQTQFSFAIKAHPADQVGADRLVNAEAAVREFPKKTLIIVDSGTATTVCAIKDGAYLGGAIMPGIELSVETLAKRTAKLFAVELKKPERAIGPNTESAIKSGILFGYASMVQGMVERFKDELGAPDAFVIATGGVARVLKDVVHGIDAYEPELTLKGLAYLYLNQKVKGAKSGNVKVRLSGQRPRSERSLS